MTNLEVQIGADVKDLIKKLDLTEKQLKDLEKLSQKTGKGFDKGLKGAESSVSKLGKSTANATPTLQEFSRVIQDAPYGIQGVANNITQLTSQFGYLKNQTGSTKAALKAVVGTLTGPAGILLAVSAVTSILVSYGDEILEAVGSTDKLTESTKEFLGEAKSEITQLQALVSIAKNESKSRGVREQAIKQLNEKYKDYLGNLSLETINSEKAKVAVDELTKSLIREAQIRGISKLIEEKALELAEDEIEAKKNAEKQSKKIIAVNKATTKSYQEQREAFATFGKDYKNIIDSISKESGKRFVSGAIEEDTKEAREEINEFTNFLQQKLEEQLEFDSLFKIKKGSGSKAGREIAESVNSGIESVGINTDSLNIDDVKNDFGGLKEVVSTSLNDASEASKIFASAVGNSFHALSSQIAQSMQTGNAVVDAFTSSLISSLAQLAAAQIQALITEKIIGKGKLLVEQSKSNANAITAATNTAAAIPVVGSALLPGLIASNLAIVNGAFAGLQAFAKGGFSGDNNLAYLNKNELVLRPFEQAALFNALRGTGISANNNNSNTSTNEGIIGETIMRGTTQVIQYRRANRKMSKYYNS